MNYRQQNDFQKHGFKVSNQWGKFPFTSESGLCAKNAFLETHLSFILLQIKFFSCINTNINVEYKCYIDVCC